MIHRLYGRVNELLNSVFQNLEFREKRTVIGSFNAMTFSIWNVHCQKTMSSGGCMMLAIAMFLWVLPRKSSSRCSSSLPIQNVFHPGFANFVYVNIRLCSLHYSLHQLSHNKSGQGSFLRMQFESLASCLSFVLHGWLFNTLHVAFRSGSIQNSKQALIVEV